jgi:hypothetical protein
MPILRGTVTLLVVALAAPRGLGAPAGATASYQGRIRLPIDLATGDGIELRQGRYDLEVRLERGHYALIFSTGQAVRAIVNGQISGGDDPESAPLAAPLTGVLFLRSTADPLPTEEERHNSKTGRPQYEEQARDWKTTLRVYGASRPEAREVRFLFQERQPRGRWSRVRFTLYRKAGGR